MTDTEWLILTGLGAMLALAACWAHHLLTRDKPWVDLAVEPVVYRDAAVVPAPISEPEMDDPVEIVKWLRNMAYCRGNISDLDAGYLLGAALVISTSELRTQQAVVSALEAAEAYRVREDPQ